MKTTAEIFADYQAAFNILGRLSVLKTARQKTGKILPLMSSSHLFADVPADLPEDVSAIYTSFDLPPTKAVDFIRTLTPVTREIFDGLSRQYQVDAITITGVTDLRLIDKIRDELADVVMSGATKDAFRSAVDDLTDAAGVARLTSPTIDTVFSANAQKNERYAVGDLIALTDDEAKALGPAVEPYTAPVSEMSADQLAKAAADAKAREKAETGGAKK